MQGKGAFSKIDVYTDHIKYSYTKSNRKVGLCKTKITDLSDNTVIHKHNVHKEYFKEGDVHLIS